MVYSKIARVATCQLNQWALDFDGNLARVKESIREAKKLCAKFRTGPELELSGYGCEDHFLESDTIDHCWESLAEILKDENLTRGILCDIGMPVMFRPKIDLSGDGNYRESRYFASWSGSDNILYDMHLNFVHHLGIRQRATKFGNGVIECLNATLASETCEELWTLQAPHTSLMLDGVDIIANGSGSHHELRKLRSRLDLIRSATAKGGGAYLYANQKGCDGGRLYFDGSALIVVNGKVIGMAPQFDLNDVSTLVANVDLEAIRSLRCRTASLMAQAAKSAYRYPRVFANISLCPDPHSRFQVASPMEPLFIPNPMEEIAKGPACWLWDYLRRSTASGYFVPLSGGADSAAVVTIVGSMCQMVIDECHKKNTDVITQVEDLMKRIGSSTHFPETHKDLANMLLHTCYMGSKNSSASSRRLAASIASEIGAYHTSIVIDSVVSAFLMVFESLCGQLPRFTCHGGKVAEDLAMQNIQARIRMVFSYLFASLFPWSRGTSGYLLVLGTGNVDEALRGYMTKYDCSSGDINPIGGISKVDLKKFLIYASTNLSYPNLAKVVEATPSAELRPVEVSNESESHTQTDEQDMGMTYEELSIFGRLRKINRCGPVSMLRTLLLQSHNKIYAPFQNLSPTEICKKVQHFFSSYARNRHKMTTLTPSYHAEGYSPDDNRFDHRQFLYPSFERQFKVMDDVVLQYEQ